MVRLGQPLVPRYPGGVTILTYHLVGGGTSSVVDLPLDVFRRQLSELRDVADVLSLDAAVRRLERGTATARPSVVITFDDGFDNFRTHAWPFLKATAMPCTFFVPVGFVEGHATTPLRGVHDLNPISWSALRDLAADPLVTIGSHSWCHRDLRSLDTDVLRSDLRRSRDRLQECTGRAIEHFCYPQAKFSRAVETEVASLYRTAVISGGRTNFCGRFHPLRLGRIPLRRDMPARLHAVVGSTVWLEELAASYARALT
jgi:peptidoglycan/xylan/chitin deacetylase (PgdA/CDA1 family)